MFAAMSTGKWTTARFVVFATNDTVSSINTSIQITGKWLPTGKVTLLIENIADAKL
jgi:hypothetical protein